MSEKKDSIQKVADETRDALVRHIRDNTAEDDARREAERDARVKGALAGLAREGKLPPRRAEQHAPTAWARLGPVRGPFICALLVAAVGVVGALVPVGHAGSTLAHDEALRIVLGAAFLAAWAVALAVQSWRLSRAEAVATMLVRPMSSSSAYEIVFSAPLVVAVPMTSLFSDVASILGALVCAGLIALREIDVARYVEDGRIHARAGWLWVRRESASLDQVREVRVDRDSHQGAPSYVVKLELLDTAPPPLAGEARFRSLEQANAEAERWRRALQVSARASGASASPRSC